MSNQRSLWAKIKNFELDDPDAAFSFTDRLARENGWRVEYTLRAMDEYKKFLFLLCIADHPLTPSDQIDQVWHLHLLYTESYWIDLCQRTIGRPLHHGPTRGGKQEKINSTTGMKLHSPSITPSFSLILLRTYGPTAPAGLAISISGGSM